MSKLVFIADIDIKSSPVVRASLRGDVIDDYADSIKAKDKLPEIVVFTPDGKTYLVADGMHRLHAYMKLVQKTVTADVRKGGYEEALAFALVANERHGLRRSNEDKRQCVESAIRMWPKNSNLQIAKAAQVSDFLVKTVRDEMEGSKKVKPEPVRKTADGKTRTVSQAKGNAPVQEKDRNGTVIPVSCLEYWNRADEIKDLMAHIDILHEVLKRAQEGHDKMFAQVNLTGVLADLDRAWAGIKVAIPYAVCTQCQGHPETQPNRECRLCKGTGLISRFLWDRVPAEIRRMKEQQAKP